MMTDLRGAQLGVEMREECAASERRKDEAEAEERRRLENNPFAALAALKRGTK